MEYIFDVCLAAKDGAVGEVAYAAAQHLSVAKENHRKKKQFVTSFRAGLRQHDTECMQIVLGIQKAKAKNFTEYFERRLVNDRH